MKYKHYSRKWQTQGGWAGIVLVLIIAAILVGAAAMILSGLANGMKRVAQASDEANVRKIAYDVQDDAGQALNAHSHFLANYIQLKFNKQSGKGADIDIQRLHQVCMGIFPIYHPLELRGATLVSGTIAESYSEWNKVRGTGTVEIRYNGVIPTRRIPANNLDPNEWPWAVSVTYTFPYSIDKFAFPVPEDGSHQDFGGLWRFTRNVTSWTPTKGDGSGGDNGTFGRRREAAEPDPVLVGNPRIVAHYENVIEMQAYIAIARQENNEPFNGELIGIISEPPTACNPQGPVQVIHNPDGTCEVGNCGTYVAHNFPDCSNTDPTDPRSPVYFANQYNNGLANSRDVQTWIGAGIQFLHDRNDRIGAKLKQNQFTTTMIGQISQPLIPNGSNLLKTQVYASKAVPILAQNWHF